MVPGDLPFGAGEDPLQPGNFFMQEVAEDAEDMARSSARAQRFPWREGDFAGDYEGCRSAKEWTALEPGGSVEHKNYCPGPGLLLIEGLGGGPTEVEVLVSRTDT